MQFSSKEPFNGDPEWFCGTCGGNSWEHAQFNSDCIWDPVDLRRPEYDLPQSNSTNPILLALRQTFPYASSASHRRLMVSECLVYITSGDSGWPQVYREHARKVLTRLANLREKE